MVHPQRQRLLAVKGRAEACSRSTECHRPRLANVDEPGGANLRLAALGSARLARRDRWSRCADFETGEPLASRGGATGTGPPWCERLGAFPTPADRLPWCSVRRWHRPGQHRAPVERIPEMPLAAPAETAPYVAEVGEFLPLWRLTPRALPGPRAFRLLRLVLAQATCLSLRSGVALEVAPAVDPGTPPPGGGPGRPDAHDPVQSTQPAAAGCARHEDAQRPTA